MSMTNQIKAVFEAAQTNEEVKAILSKLEKGMDVEQIKAIVCEAAAAADIQIDDTDTGELADTDLESISGGIRFITSWDDFKDELDRQWNDIVNFPETVKRNWEIFKNLF